MGWEDKHRYNSADKKNRILLRMIVLMFHGMSEILTRDDVGIKFVKILNDAETYYRRLKEHPNNIKNYRITTR